MTNFPQGPRRPASSAWLSVPQMSALEQAGTTAHRLYTFAGGWVERLGHDILVSFKSEAERDGMLAGLNAWAEAASFPIQRVFGKFLPRQNADRISPVLLSGDATLPATSQVSESHLLYHLDFEAGYSTGLFLDQRHNRLFLRRRLSSLGKPGRVLNTFAYTCAFSVAAAKEGARTTSLDLSGKSLDRGRQNFELNGLSQEGHTFIADDVLDVLPRLIRRGEKYDAIIVDPPTFSRGNKGRRFQVEQDLEHLVQQALELAAPGAAILLSTNCTRLTRRDLESIGRHCLKLNRLAGSFHAEPDLPDIPPGAAAQTVWLLLK